MVFGYDGKCKQDVVSVHSLPLTECDECGIVKHFHTLVKFSVTDTEESVTHCGSVELDLKWSDF